MHWLRRHYTEQTTANDSSTTANASSSVSRSIFKQAQNSKQAWLAPATPDSFERRDSVFPTREPELQEDTNYLWDPGGSQTIMNSHLYSLIVASSIVEALPEIESLTDLDSHANMPVVGSEAYILADLGKTLDVYPYTPDYKPLQVQWVDAAVRYESPFDGKVYILVIRNALYVP
jgi:hypothetical protein